MQLIEKYFPNLSTTQKKQFSLLEDLYIKWNSKINVISRKSIDDFYTIHVLHSLAIAKVIAFEENSQVLDVGTGGGFPGIPLAILFPNVNFLLLDSIGKKIKVVDSIIYNIGVKNITTRVERVENITKKFDFIVSRAVTNMSDFLKIIKKNLKENKEYKFNQGVFYLKGGDLNEELKKITNSIYNVSDFFDEAFFQTKKVIYVASKNI
jgi:16S rRNA (guanine527-N7)-methyltransferase